MSLRHTRPGILIVLFLLLARVAQADTVTFNDLTDTLTITQVGSTLSSLLPCNNSFSFSLGGEACTGPVLRVPSGPTVVSTTLPQTLWIGNPATGMISDVLQNNIGLNPGPTTFFFYAFFSDDQKGNVGAVQLGGPCSGTPIGGCQIMEDGTVQTAGTVTWSDSSVDTIKFQSDAIETVVPEPSTALLLLTGFAGLSILILRGRAA